MRSVTFGSSVSRPWLPPSRSIRSALHRRHPVGIMPSKPSLRLFSMTPAFPPNRPDAVVLGPTRRRHVHKTQYHMVVNDEGREDPSAAEERFAKVPRNSLIIFFCLASSHKSTSWAITVLQIAMPKSKLGREDRKMARRERKRAREAESSSGRLSKRACNNVDVAPAEITTALSEEQIFKQKHASEFEDGVQEPPFGHVKIKSEPPDHRIPQPHFLPSPAAPGSSATATVSQDSTFITSASQSVFVPRIKGSNDRERVIDTILSQRFPLEMTQSAIKQILQDAQESAKQNDEFGITQIEAQIDRLQQMGTPPPRLTEVILSLQSGLHDLARQLCSRIDSLADRMMISSIALNDESRDDVHRSRRRQSSSNSSDQEAQPATSTSGGTHAKLAKDSGTRKTASKPSKPSKAKKAKRVPETSVHAKSSRPVSRPTEDKSKSASSHQKDCYD